MHKQAHKPHVQVKIMVHYIILGQNNTSLTSSAIIHPSSRVMYNYQSTSKNHSLTSLTCYASILPYSKCVE